MENYQKTASNGESFSVLASDGKGAKVEVISDATTLTAADAGKVFILSAAAGAQVALPPVAMTGFYAKFIIGAAFATTNWTIFAATAVIQGSVIVNSTDVPGANEDTISFVASAETVGDWAEVVSDGTNWYVNGLGHSAGSITLTDA